MLKWLRGPRATVCSPMAQRRPWRWKELACLAALLPLILFWCLLLLTEHVEKTGQPSSHFLAVRQEKPPRPRSGTPALARVGVDFGSLFSGTLSEPHCERGQVLLILVTSAPGHAVPRHVIRTSWAARERPRAYSWQVVFLIGQTAARETARQLQREQQAFGDILGGNYLDTYWNLTLKVMHGLKWALERCQPSYILKTDDDCFVNTEWLPEFLAKQSVIETGLYAGSLFPREKRRVVRQPSSKWYVSREDYPPDEYPPYASGIGYVLSRDAAARILQVAEFVRPIPVEDAYVGILAQQAGLPLKSSARFAKQNASWRLCNYRYLMVIHHLGTREQKVATESMRKARHACQDSLEITRWK